MLTHNKLWVYEKALSLAASAQAMSTSWGRRHAVVEHFRRAAESIVLNIAEGNGRYAEWDHRRFLEIAMGSAVKACAYLELYRQKALHDQWDIAVGTELLSRIAAMLSHY